jgi:hypothetical protein
MTHHVLKQFQEAYSHEALLLLLFKLPQDDIRALFGPSGSHILCQLGQEEGLKAVCTVLGRQKVVATHHIGVEMLQDALKEEKPC